MAARRQNAKRRLIGGVIGVTLASVGTLPLPDPTEPNTSGHRGHASHEPTSAARGQRKPDLFVIGAMKSGTTYLNKLLDAHPAIFMCSPEEPSYFVDPKQLRILWPEAWDLGFWRDEEHYLRLFRSSGDAAVLGEASTNYTKRPLISGVPERIHTFNPDARFIYLLRDPVQRTLSHYWHMVRYHAERRPMLEAIRTDSQYLDVSNYAMQLTPYLELFGASRVMVVTFEQLTRNPAMTMRQVYDWLGVDGAEVDIPGLDVAENVTPEVLRMAAWRGVLQHVRRSRPFRLLTPSLPRTLRERAVQFATHHVDRRTFDASQATNFLRPLQTRQTESLTRLVGRRFPEWRTLHGGADPRTPRWGEGNHFAAKT